MKTIRIGAGLGFYGDSWEPVRVSIERGGVDYIASDHLAELTLAILQKDRARDAALGYTRDLVPMLTALWPLAASRSVKFVLNASGLNPNGARDALAAAFEAKGFDARIATVTGDDVLARIDALQVAGDTLAHLDTGAKLSSVRERLVFANAYLGAAPIVRALQQGADIRRYFSPDVVLDMGHLRLEDLGHDRVRVSHATGHRPPTTLKVMAGYEDGWLGQCVIGFCWPDAMAKARATIDSVRTQLAERKLEVDEVHAEFIGHDSFLGPHADHSHEAGLNEVWLRMAVRGRERRVADAFPRLFPWMALSGAPFMGGFHGVTPASQLLGVWPALVARERIEEHVEVTISDVGPGVRT